MLVFLAANLQIGLLKTKKEYKWENYEINKGIYFYWKMKKYAVITFLFNDYDLLREPLYVDDNADYYCLTDDSTLTSKTWTCVYLEKLDSNLLLGTEKTYIAKYSFYKYIPNSYDYFITIDASIEIANNLSPIIDMMDKENNDIGLSMHNYRSTWNDEYNVWISQHRVDKKYFDIFSEYAISKGYNPSSKTGLIECTMKIYKNTKNVIDFISDVYDVLKETNDFKDKNDQCYFTLVLSKHIDRMNPLFFCRQLYANSKYFNLYYHKTKRLCHNEVTVERNPNILFGKIVKINEF